MVMGRKSAGWWVDWVASRVHRQHRSGCPDYVRLQQGPAQLAAPRSAGCPAFGVGPDGFPWEYLIPGFCSLRLSFCTVWRCVALLPESRGRYDRNLGQSFLERKKKFFSDQINFGNDTQLQNFMITYSLRSHVVKKQSNFTLVNWLFSKISELSE